jgi:hypothetical protein
MCIALGRSTLEKPIHLAALAVHLAGYFDGTPCFLGQLADHPDAVMLTAVLGNLRALAEREGAAGRDDIEVATQTASTEGAP